MAYIKARIPYVILILALVIIGVAMYVSSGSGKTDTQSSDMSGMSDMSSCPMMNGSHAGNSDPDGCDMSSGGAASGGCDMSSMSMQPKSMALKGSVLSVNKAKHKVTVQLELPATGEAVKTLSKVRVGEHVIATVAPDNNGNISISKLAVDSGKNISFDITGIQCQACADRLQTSLNAVPGVNHVTVNANSSRATIIYDPAKVSIDKLKLAIRNTEPIHKGMPFGVKG